MFDQGGSIYRFRFALLPFTEFKRLISCLACRWFCGYLSSPISAMAGIMMHSAILSPIAAIERRDYRQNPAVERQGDVE
jgi:hypothetical protein